MKWEALKKVKIRLVRKPTQTSMQGTIIVEEQRDPLSEPPQDQEEFGSRFYNHNISDIICS